MENTGEVGRRKTNRKAMEENVMRVRDLARRGFVSEALAELDTLVRADPGCALYAYTRALIIAEGASPRHGLIAAREFVSRFPQDRNGHVLLAWVYLTLEQPEESLRHVEIAEEGGWASDETRALRAQCRFALGQLEVGDELVSIAADDHVSGKHSAWARGLINWPKTEPEMIKAAEQIRDQGCGPDPAAVYMAHWYLSAARVEDALSTLEDALRGSPDSALLVRELAGVEIRRGHLDEGAELLTNLLQRNPAELDSARWLARYHLRKLHFRTALAIMRRSVQAHQKILKPK